MPGRVNRWLEDWRGYHSRLRPRRKVTRVRAPRPGQQYAMPRTAVIDCEGAKIELIYTEPAVQLQLLDKTTDS